LKQYRHKIRFVFLNACLYKRKHIANPTHKYFLYYILYDEDLKKLELEIKNLDNSLYIVNYDSGEVYITNPYKGKYRLSEIDK